MEKVITVLNVKPLLLSYNNKKIHKIIIKNFINNIRQEHDHELINLTSI